MALRWSLPVGSLINITLQICFVDILITLRSMTTLGAAGGNPLLASIAKCFTSLTVSADWKCLQRRNQAICWWPHHKTTKSSEIKESHEFIQCFSLSSLHWSFDSKSLGVIVNSSSSTRHNHYWPCHWAAGNQINFYCHHLMSISGKIENLIRISWFKSDNATSLLAEGHQMLWLVIFKTNLVPGVR